MISFKELTEKRLEVNPDTLVTFRRVVAPTVAGELVLYGWWSGRPETGVVGSVTALLVNCGCLSDGKSERDIKRI